MGYNLFFFKMYCRVFLIIFKFNIYGFLLCFVGMIYFFVDFIFVFIVFGRLLKRRDIKFIALVILIRFFI